MPNVSDLNTYLTTNDVKEKDLIKFIDAGQFVEKDFRGEKRTRLEITIALGDGKKKTYTPNKTTVKSISSVYGNDTAQWIGKLAEVTLVSQNVAGEMKKVLYATPISEE